MMPKHSKRRPLFALGQVVATPGALQILETAEQDAGELLRRHQQGDFGTLSWEDREANWHAILDGDRILSVYIIKGGEKLWVITEADRSSTCLLTPDEY